VLGTVVYGTPGRRHVGRGAGPHAVCTLAPCSRAPDLEVTGPSNADSTSTGIHSSRGEAGCLPDKLQSPLTSSHLSCTFQRGLTPRQVKQVEVGTHGCRGAFTVMCMQVGAAQGSPPALPRNHKSVAMVRRRGHTSGGQEGCVPNCRYPGYAWWYGHMAVGWRSGVTSVAGTTGA
jgi:hypothetical protein